MSPGADRIRRDLRCVRPGCKCARAEGLVHCPVPGHGDDGRDAHPSLSLDERNGRVLVRCQIGCTQDQVLDALRARGLWPPARGNGPLARPRSRVVARYDYRDERGLLLFQVERLAPKAFRQRRPNGKGGWIYNLDGVRRVLYGLPELLASPANAVVYICEGEKDVDRLRALGLVATTNPQGAGQWRPEYAEPLRGRRVVILPDNDGAGQGHAQHVARALLGVAASVKVIAWPS